jgi:PadR family transcriptional regulator PadR
VAHGGLLLTFDTSPRTVLSNSDNPYSTNECAAMTQPATDLLRGTLDLLILRTIQHEPMHGWAISHRIQQQSREALQVGQGSLYPALQRLEQRGWIDSEWSATEQNRRAKYYRLTKSGRRALGEEMESWRRYVEAVDLILEPG